MRSLILLTLLASTHDHSLSPWMNGVVSTPKPFGEALFENDAALSPAYDDSAATGGEPSPTFDLVAGATTPNDLSDSLTVNGTAMTLVLACDAQGISGTNWTCRDASGSVVLTEAGTGSSPTSSTLTPWKALDSTERVAAYAATGKRHDAATSTVGDISTDDFVVELVGKASSAGTSVFFDKGLAGTDGWRLTQNGTAGTNLQLRTGSVTSTVTNNGQSTSWFHYIAFVDRNEASTNGGIGYMNGTAGGGTDMSARSGSVSNASSLSLGAANGLASVSANMASLRIWRCAACFAGGATNSTQWAPVARQRTALAFGVAPSIAAGSSAPTTLARGSTAHVDVVDGSTRQIYLIAANAPRVARRTSQGSPIAGYLSEPAVSNIALQSQTLGTTWAAITAGDNVLADAYAGADLTVTGDDLDGNNSNAEHGLRQSITVTAASYTFSAWAKTGTQNFVALRNATIANGAAWFDVATCTSSSCTIGEDCAAAVGTVQAGITRASAERYPVDTTGDGVADVSLCRVAITYTGTAAAHNHDLLCAPSNGNLTYTDADATADCGFWGVRVEAFQMATSYLATTTAAVQRNGDDLRFDGASHYTGSPSTIDVDALCPNYDVNSALNYTLASIGFVGANSARMSITSNERAYFEGFVSPTVEWSITAPSGDATDGTRHLHRTLMETNNVTAYYDNTLIGSDTSANLVASSGASVFIGTNTGQSSQLACLINRARLWSSLVAP